MGGRARKVPTRLYGSIRANRERIERARVKLRAAMVSYLRSSTLVVAIVRGEMTRNSLFLLQLRCSEISVA